MPRCNRMDGQRRYFDWRRRRSADWQASRQE